MISPRRAMEWRAAQAMAACALLLQGCSVPTNRLPPDPVYTIELTPSADTLTAAAPTRRFSALARDIDYETVPGVRFTWSSADTTIATVDASGLTRAKGPGTTTITATADGIVGTAALTVLP